MKRRKFRLVLTVLLTILFVLLAGAGGLAYYVYYNLQPVEAGGATVRVAVPPGTTPAGVASELEKAGLIRDARIFTYYLKYKGEGSRFQAGEYDMTAGMTLDEIIAKLNKGETVKAETLRFTIPEGFTVEQIAARLAELGYVDKEEFLRLADAKTDYGSKAAATIPDDGKLQRRLEGYLFPQTYELPKDSGPEDILKRMLSQLDRELEALPADWQDRMKSLGLTLHQVLTVASLVEREVVVDEERALVAGVIYNRLQKKMPLQIDATVQYALGEQKERLFEKDLQVDHPYNTYRNQGLPPGPIASPSRKSIEAALYPKTSNYLFYVTKKDGSQGHLFAETYQEHLHNIAASNKTAGAQ
ncbi:endolytic transglycosylase MltG [Paenibacillus thermoaerophilus]|uniref:Endolytic murein transglycosylase n=1 Tax=Paenibacillus thermoaerophilus TaxID=1215385 RepID=A0ABW2UZH6_9BACL|nr:endolytic transglycosylase MltG [Paenibacillus thermoaerophilus]TMV17347.1 endolytic transglycosylase MltG [Paenibacillus thermoaerophilus]